MTPAEGAAGLGARKLVLVDVRAPNEPAAGRVRGAVNIPLGQLGSRLPELDGERRVVNVRGGVIAWTRAGLPLFLEGSR